MSYGQFMTGHAWLTVAYRKAHRRRREQANFDAYLMGAYVYDAVRRLSPALNPFSKARPEQWMEEPYGLYSAGASCDQGRNIPDEGEAPNAAVAFMQAYMADHNASLERKRAARDDT